MAKRGIKQQRTVLSWIFVCTLFVLCGILGVLQYRWITEVSLTARDRLHDSLQHSLTRVSQDFDTAVASTYAALTPANLSAGPQGLQSELVERYARWRKTTRNGAFNHIALAIPQANGIELRMLDLDQGVLTAANWPPQWEALRERLESNLTGPPRDRGPGRDGPEYYGAYGGAHGSPMHGPNQSGRGNGGPEVGPPPRPGAQAGRRPPGRSNSRAYNDGLLFEEPLFSPRFDGTRSGATGRGEVGWLIFDLRLDYLKDVLLPRIVRRDLGSAYQVEVITRNDPPSVIYESDPGHGQDVAGNADASISLFESPGMRSFGPGGSPGMRGPGGGRGPGPARGPGPFSDGAHWEMYVRHRAGSLEAVVAESRMRSLAVTGGVLLLMLATAGALIRYTRRAQKLAGLQMEFVAAVSHELRTPLTVIHTAAYNLQGKLAHNPSQVERYGALIQQESARLGELVEQVLLFASANSGRVIREREPLSVETVIDESVESSQSMIDDSHCVVEKTVAPGLPPVLGDSRALRHAIQNLVCNAVKYGGPGNNWIGISASKAAGDSPAAIEIRVADRGPGIPEDEQEYIFDPFFRGARAVQDQIHGTGLGLSLVKKIVEAHGGNVRVKSEPMKGAEFIVWLPAAPAGVAG